MGNMIFGGLRIIEMEDENDHVFFREDSDAADTVRPLFLINGKETTERVRLIATWIDAEIPECRALPVHVGDDQYRVYCLFYPCFDGKIIRMYYIFQLFVYILGCFNDFLILDFVVVLACHVQRGQNVLTKIVRVLRRC